MNIYLVRHGETQTNIDGIVCGQLDTHLTERGIEQAKKLADVLQDIEFDALITTPLQRAYQTANYAYPSDKYIKIEALMETHTGTASEWTLDELHKYDERYLNHGLYSHLKYPGGESIDDVYNRMINWFKTFIKQSASMQNVLIVGHGGTVNVLIHYLLNVPIHLYPAFNVKNGSCAQVKYDIQYNTAKLITFNQTEAYA